MMLRDFSFLLRLQHLCLYLLNVKLFNKAKRESDKDSKWCKIFYLYLLRTLFSEKEYVRRNEGRDISFSENVLKVKSVLCVCVCECNSHSHMYQSYLR